MSTQARRRPRHLLDPATLGRPGAVTAEDRARRAREKAKLEQVQRWVLSTLAVTTILHMSAGLIVAAYFIDVDRAAARYGLSLIAGVFGVAAVAAGLALHRQRLWSPWLLLGWLPTVIGLLFLNR